MKFKYIFLSLFAICFCFLFSNKVSATNAEYCSYGSLKLTLPVTISVDISGFNATYPFDVNKNYYYTDSLYVYDKDSCKTNLNIPTFSGNNGMDILNDGFDVYYVSMTFYYSYNNIYYMSDNKLINGHYSTIDTTPPKISSSALSFVVSMEEQKPLDYFSSTVFAYDSIDSNIDPEISEDYYSDSYNIPGIYSIIYKACDKSYNCSKLIQTVKVVDITPPIIKGIESIDSYMSNPLSLFQIGNKLTATDNLDGDISSSIFLTDSYYNTTHPGTYYALFGIIDSSGNEVLSPHKIVINYFDDISPTLEGPTIFKSYLSNPLSIQNILAQIIAHDNVDNDVNKNLYIVSDQYGPSKNFVGIYSLVIGCYDSFGNESIPYIIKIEVIDNVAPSISGPNRFNSYLSNPLTLSEIKNKLISLDNHDGNITNSIEIIYENYLSNIDKLGIYTITFISKDNSDNYSPNFTIEITNVDDVSPVIEGENYYLTLTNKKLSILSLQYSLNAIDNVDGNISHLIELNEDTYSSNYNTPGTYFLTYYVADKSGNISIPFKIKITVNEDMSFIQSINNSTIYISTQKLASDSDILSMLNIFNDEYSSITTLENNYYTNYKNIGNYKIVYELTNTDFTHEYLTVNIATYNEEQEKKEEIIKEKKKETIFSYIVTFFTSLFQNIVLFFKH